MTIVQLLREQRLLAKLLEERERPVPPPPDPRRRDLALAMRLVASALETRPRGA